MKRNRYGNHKYQGYGYRPYGGRRGKPWVKALLALLILGAVVFAALEVRIALFGRTAVEGDPQVMVIFGCKVEKTGPSVTLRDRLDTALSYLEDHPDMTVVVSGGMGDDEHQSEAQCMYDYLTARGVDGGNILQEDASRNTWQNVNNTMDLLTGEGYTLDEDVLLVSSGFHLSRIHMLWERARDQRELEGEQTISTLAAPVSYLPAAVRNVFREPLALVKSFVVDR